MSGDYTTDWHLQMPTVRKIGGRMNQNVYCLNGSAYLRRTSHYGSTTCPKCKRIFKGKSTATEEAQR